MEDDKIVQLYWDRDEKAISATSEKYGAYCLSISRNILGCHEDAQECVNDTYLKTWNTIPPYRPQVFPAFLGKVTRDISFNRYRKDRRQKRGGGQIPIVLDELSEVIADRSNSQETDRIELAETINTFLSTLSPDSRNVFILRYWYAYSTAEIAKRLGITENKVCVSLSRTRKKLKEHLSEGEK